MLLEAESIFPLFYENTTEAYLLVGCGVINNSTGKYRRQLSLPTLITTLIKLLKSFGNMSLTGQ